MITAAKYYIQTMKCKKILQYWTTKISVLYSSGGGRSSIEYRKNRDSTGRRNHDIDKYQNVIEGKDKIVKD